MSKKTMRKMRKALLSLCCAALLVCVAVGATVAYLTSTTTTVKNTFTVGNVTITLDEKDTDDSTKDADRDTANKYDLIPGHNLVKDPTVHVVAGSSDCYVRAFVKVNNFADLKNILGISDDDTAAAKIATYATGYETDKWTAKGWKIKGDTVTYEFRVTNVVTKSDNVQDFAVFTGITVPADLTNEQIALLDDLSIDVVAQAIQADGFDDAEDAWEAWD